MYGFKKTQVFNIYRYGVNEQLQHGLNKLELEYVKFLFSIS